MTHHEGAHRAIGSSTLEINIGASATRLLPLVEQSNLAAAPDYGEQALKFDQRARERADAEYADRVRRLATLAIVIIPEGMLAAGIGIANLVIQH